MRRKQLVFVLLVGLISGFLGGVLSIWFLMPPSVWAQDEVPKVIEAREFRVVDEEGKARIELTSRISGAPALVFYGDREGDFRVILDQSSLEIYGPDKNQKDYSRLHFLVSSETGPQIILVDEHANYRAVLGSTQLTHPDTGSTEIRAPSSLVLFDEYGNVVWSAP